MAYHYENVLAAQFDDAEIATSHSLLIDEVAEEIFQRDWNGVDAVIAKNAKTYRVSEESFSDWLLDISERTDVIKAVMNGDDLRLHAKECATDFVEYCVANYNIWA